jgi:hypothetical protein
MNALTVTGHIDQHHRLSADVPASIPTGPVIVSIVPIPAEDDAGDAWMAGIVRDWASDLNDADQDIYTLEDGEPVRES